MASSGSGDESSDRGVVAPSSLAFAHASDSCFSTPLIDISDLGGSGSGCGDNSRNQQPLHGISPEAGLHRDGEQARLIEGVRRRQQNQRQHREETTFEWLEESASQFWESILVYGGLIEDPRNDPFHRSRHSTIPLNPYRDKPRPPLDRQSEHEQNNNSLFSSVSKTKHRENTAQPLADGPPSSKVPPFYQYPRIIRFVMRALLRTLCSMRRCIDICITYLAHLQHLPPSDTSSMYSSSPMYSIHITADDVLILLSILGVSFYCSSRLQLFAGPVIVSLCSLMRAVSKKVARRVHPPENQLQNEQQQQSTRKKEAAVSTMPTQELSTLNAQYASKDQLHAGRIQRLQKQYPNATYAECKRFLACVKYEEEAASKRIDNFLKWRADCGLKPTTEAGGNGTLPNSRNGRIFDQTFVKKDEEDWDAAAKMAISIITKSHVTTGLTKLPQIICSYEEQVEDGLSTNNRANTNEELSLSPPRCKDGTRIFHILSARLDLSIATAYTYSLATALYLDRCFSRSTTERVSLICDVRGGRGWANPTPWSMLPFIQSTALLLGSHYPERLERLVLFPMPKSAIWVWSAAQKCLDTNTSSKVVIVSSGEGNGLPTKLTDFVCEESLNTLQKRRRSFYLD
eukprot:CAMPEP_0181131170 /NCGR_PEP_ID=MMETSP1071-20121207/30280_1 /TAXON_ID=35127 /ORGANISM="Thalassiosira sp., Strain NH16" /LENGTH=628 /DNA_ID=CAMNT_0023217341 /DNA_START=31 /DNA_END=1917 /DNA_ORIENTATION=-